MKQIAKFLILVIFAQALGVYAIGLPFESDDTSIHSSHAEAQLDTKSCDEMLECDNNCYDCCNCIVLLQSHFDNNVKLQSLNNLSFSTFLYNLPASLYKPPRSFYS